MVSVGSGRTRLTFESSPFKCGVFLGAQYSGGVRRRLVRRRELGIVLGMPRRRKAGAINAVSVWSLMNECTYEENSRYRHEAERSCI